MRQSAFMLLVMLLLLGGCTTAAPAAPPLVPAAPLGRSTPTPNAMADAWLRDEPRVITVEAGYIKGLRVALSDTGHAHAVYQASQEWLDDRSEAALIVAGITPTGDRYEQHLATMSAGLDLTSIAAQGERVLVSAGLKDGRTIRLRLWESMDGGRTWTEREQPIAGATQADGAFLADGRALLVATVPSGTDAQTVLALETEDGWQVMQPFPRTANGHAHAVWTRDAHALDTLPAAVVLASRSGGAWTSRTDDGVTWTTSELRTATPWTPTLVAAGDTLLLVHHVYGRTGVWVARSRDGARTWESAHLWAGTPDHNLENATFVWSAHDEVLGLVAARADLRSQRRSLVLMTVPLADVLTESAYTPDWRTADAWLPWALAPGYTDQFRPHVAQRGDQVLVGYESWDFPRPAPEGAIAAVRSQPLWTVLRPGFLADAAEQRGGTP